MKKKQQGSAVSRVSMKDAERLLGMYVALWRKSAGAYMATPAKILAVDQEKLEVSYLICGGLDKGKKCVGNYDPVQTVDVYDESNVILAALQ